MRLVHGLFIVSTLLFVTGVGFVIAGARSARQAPATPEVALTPVASVRHIMRGIVVPAADTVFGAVGTTITSDATVEKAPANADEWDAVENSAAALIEAGNLMLMGRRVVDQGDWVKYSQALIAGAQMALTAAQNKDAAGVFDAGEPILCVVQRLPSEVSAGRVTLEIEDCGFQISDGYCTLLNRGTACDMFTRV